MRLPLRLVPVVFFAAFLGGDAQQPVARYTGFISDYTRITAVNRNTTRYVSPRISEYSKFIVDPVQSRLSGGVLSPSDRDEALRYMRATCKRAVTQAGYSVTDEAGQGVARFRFALTDIAQSVWWEKLHPVSRATGTGTGGAAMEGELIDSVTGEQLAAVVRSSVPDKLKQMQNLFYGEARKHDVLPLDNSTLLRFLTPRPSPTAGKTQFEYSGAIAGIPAAAAPSIIGRSFRVEAQIDVPEGGAQGAIAAEGGRFGGYALIVGTPRRDGGRPRPALIFNLLGMRQITWEDPELAPGAHTIVFDFKYDGPGFGKGGTGTLTVDGVAAATKAIEHTTPVMFPEDESFDVGMDTRTGVPIAEYRYESPFRFTGTIKRLSYQLGDRMAVQPK
ncbi:MAG: DUF3313 family protein [Phycisphaerales bacterium]|nr:DUF3313 family protein [Phycisphaerales bacterium]